MQQSGCIIIDVELSDSTTKRLRITKQFKQEFREFVRINNLSKEDSFALKNIVQAKLIQKYIYAHSEAISPASQHQRLISQSPRFKEIQNQQQKSKNSTEAKDGNSLYNDVKAFHQLKLDSFGMKNQPSYSTINFSNSQQMLKLHSQQNSPASITEQQKQQIPDHQPTPYQFQQPKNIYPAEEANQSTEAYLHSKNDTKTQKKEEGQLYRKNIPAQTIKRLNFQSQKVPACYGRLYKAQTDSFKSKKNEQIDHKQANDYLEVEKYLLANNLKRVSPQVHEQLYKKSTESSKAKYTPKKKQQSSILTPEVQKEKSHKKLSTTIKSDKHFKGSQWKSGSRCERNIIMAQQERKKNMSKQKQRQIRRRMFQQQEKSHPKVHEQHKSRSCEKCSPKKTPQKKQKKRQTKPFTPQLIKRPYVRNVLLESYQQFFKGIPSSKLEKSKIADKR